jgi:hypothetical protein
MSTYSDSDIGAMDAVFNSSAKSYVWYKLPSRTTTFAVPVEFGEYFCSIRKKIYNRHVIIFKDVDVANIMIYELDKSAEPLDGRTKWNSSVYWGTEDAPLLVKVNIESDGMII